MKSWIILVAFIISNSVSSQGQRTTSDSLALVLETAKDSSEISILLELCHLYLFTQPDTALQLANKAYIKSIQYARQLKDEDVYKKLMAEAANRVGTAHYLLGDFSNALIQWDNFLRITQGRKDKKGIALAYGNLGIAYRLQGNLVKALENQLWALKLDRDLLRAATSRSDSEAIAHSKNGIARHLSNVGIVYDENGEYEKALEYYLEALSMSTQLGNKASMAAMLGNIGLVFAEREDYEQALSYYFKAVTIDLELGNNYSLCAWYSNIGAAYQWQGVNEPNSSEFYKTSFEYYTKGLAIAERMDSKTFIAGGLNSIGVLYTIQGNYSEALKYLKKSLDVSLEIGLLVKIKLNRHGLAELYEKTGEYEKAFAEFKEYTTMKDSIFSEDKSKEIGKLEAKHEFEAAESEKRRLEEEQRDMAELAMSRRNNLQYSGILIFLVLLGGALSTLGKLRISVRLAEGLIFFSFLLFFEFTLVLLDPYIEQYSSGAPAIKLAFNAVLAGLIFPLHSFFEAKIKKRLMH